jgi:hypothetical protein
MLSDPSSDSTTSQSTPLPREQEVTQTETYNGKVFHLHQVVSFPRPNEPSREMIVVGLNDGLELATPDFEWKTEYRPEDIPDSIDPQVAETGVPVFGY